MEVYNSHGHTCGGFDETPSISFKSLLVSFVNAFPKSRDERRPSPPWHSGEGPGSHPSGTTRGTPPGSPKQDPSGTKRGSPPGTPKQDILLPQGELYYRNPK